MLKSKKIISCLLLIVFISGLVGCGQKKFDLMEIITINYTGFDGEGRASVYPNWDDIEKYLKSNANSNTAITSANIKALEDSVEYDLAKNSDLSNGDKINVTVTFDKELAKKLGLNLKGKSKTVTVDGLKEGTDADLFGDDIKLDFTGTSPNIQVKVINNSSEPFFKSVSYKVEPSSGLKKGDTVTVTASVSESEAEEYGYKIKERTKDYTVDDVDEYVASIDKINDDGIKKMDSESKDLIKSTFSTQYNYTDYVYNCLTKSVAVAKFKSEFNGVLNYYSTVDMSSVKINSIDIAKKYLLNLKSDRTLSDTLSSDYNKLYIVYKVNITDNCFPDSLTVYVPVRYKNVILKSDGDIEVKLDDAKMVKGSDNMDELYRNIVTVDKDNYDCEEK